MHRIHTEHSALIANVHALGAERGLHGSALNKAYCHLRAVRRRYFRTIRRRRYASQTAIAWQCGRRAKDESSAPVSFSAAHFIMRERAADVVAQTFESASSSSEKPAARTPRKRAY